MPSDIPNNLQNTFGQVKRHRLIGQIIRRFSTNTKNIYREALVGIVQQRPINVLDIGCGYGRFTSNLSGVIDINSFCTGIDLLDNNRKPYLDTLKQSGFNGRFIHGAGELVTTFKSRSQHLILASYSLNFMGDTISSIARILHHDGWFIVITHSRQFLIELVNDINSALHKLPDHHSPDISFQHLVTSFNAEIGAELLNRYFSTVKQIYFPNKLNFPSEHFEKCMLYIEFKLPLIFPQFIDDPELCQTFMFRLRKEIRKVMDQHHHYVLNKNDSIFQCRDPIG